MKNIFKLLLASLVFTMIFSCKDEADRDWATQEASFKLHDTSLGTNVLYETMKDNPITFSWDGKGAGEYSVVMSTTENFQNKTVIGTTTQTNFTTTVGELNTKLLQLGFAPFTPQSAFVRIEKGSEVSNSITYTLSVYPTEGPIVTTPTNGSVIALNSSDESANAIVVTWNDYSNYGSEVKYLVEMAKKGSASFISLGEVTNIKSLAVTNKDLNTAALNSGALVNVESEIDFRVTAKTAFSTPGIELKSAVVTAKLTPYQIDYPNFYLVGAASVASWDASKAGKLYKHDNISEVYTYLQPDGFRFLGQADWNPINYSIDADGIRDNYKYFKTVSSNVEKGDGDENMKFTGEAGMYKVVINADFSVKSLTVTPSPIFNANISKLYLVGSINGWDAGNAIEMTALGDGKFEFPIQIPDGAEFKFIGQQSWGDLDWGNISGTGNTGYVGPKGDNGNVKFDGGNGVYKITVDLRAGTYKIDQL